MTRKNITYYLILLFVSATALVIAVTGFVLAWFISNEDAKLGSPDLTVEQKINLEITTSLDNVNWTDSTLLNFADFYCGSKNRQKLFVRIINKDTEARAIGLRIDAPNSSAGDQNEVPFEIDNGDEVQYYYLGSQIKLTEISAVDGASNNVSLSGYVIDTLPFLVETARQGAGQANYVTTKKEAIEMLPLLAGLTLGGRSTMIFTFEFEFVDNGTDQSIYQNFNQKDGGCCCRRQFKVIADRIKTGG